VSHHHDIPATKIHAPRIRSHLVHRQRLLAQLEAGRDRALTLLSAPAGFGKTTVLVDWLTSRGSGEDSPAVAWVALDEDDNDPVRFLRVLIIALRVSDPHFGESLLDMLQSPPHPPFRSMLTVLINDLVASGRRVTLVLDDYQEIRNQQVHDAVAFLLEKPPAFLRVVIATREDPPLPLPHLRASAALCEVRADDLRFTPDEVASFVEEVMGRRLSSEDLASLARRTEGWVVGLQLICLSMPAQADAASGFIADLAGSRRYLLDYLVDEVLTRQPPSVATFLLHTAVLDRLSAPLCSAVLGEENPDEIQSRLDAVAHRNLFLIPLDEDRRWYRYHHLFADLLRARLSSTEPALFNELHRRASAWYEGQGFTRDTIHHALAAADFDRAADLVESNAMRYVARGEIHAALEWCRRLPAVSVQSRPRLGVAYAYALVLTDQPDLAEAQMQEVERGLPPDAPIEAVGGIRGRVALLRALAARGTGDLDRSVTLATEADGLLPERDAEGRAWVQMLTAGAFQANGDVTSASERLIVSAAKYAGRLGFPALERASLSGLAGLYMCQGRLRRAAKIFARAEQAAGAHIVLGAPVYYFGRGELLRQWNELDRAEPLLQRGIESLSALNGVDAWVAARGYICLARLRQARGDSRGAMAVLDAFTVLARQREMSPSVLVHAAAARAQLWLLQGNPLAASQWAATCGVTPDDAVRYLRELEYGVLARVLITHKNRAAMVLLDRLLADAEVHGRMGSAIEILVLSSLAWRAFGDRSRAISTLARALALGEPEGYVRVFVDEGAPMASLLRRAHVQGIAPEYAARLLGVLEARRVDPASEVPRAARSMIPGAELQQSSPVVEALTAREYEVLRLVVLGASNDEIARKLTVSPATVKRHLSHIFDKFGVRSRTQAIQTARVLHFD